MTMRDNVELAKESAEKSERILQLEDDLAWADMLIGNIIRTAIQDGYMDFSDIRPVDSPAP